MEALTNMIGPSAPPVASRPRWLMLNYYVNDEDADPTVTDAMTTAASFTSSGQRFTVSFAPAPPPATTRFYCNWIGGAPPADEEDLPGASSGRDKSKDLRIIAVHDNSILINMRVPEWSGGVRNQGVLFDYFLYETGGGGAGARLPTLSLLPGCYVSKQFDRKRDAGHVPTRSDRPRSLDVANTAMLRAGDGDGGLALVAQLEVMYGDPPHNMAELCVLRPGREWEIRRLHIEHHDGGVLPQWPTMDAAVAVGRRFMCWVDYVTGIFMCDMAAESSKLRLRYVPLPVPPPEKRHRNSDRPYLVYCRNLAATGPDTVRFVSVSPRCCCGGAGKTDCERSRFAFNVTTWNLTLRMEEPMTWVKDVVLDCDELWQLPNNGSLPRVAPQYPIMSSDNPDMVCFTLCENYYFIENADETEWMIKVDTRRKELLAAILADTNLYIDNRLPANLRWQQLI